MSLKSFYKNFGLTPDLDTERVRFVNRINQSAFFINYLQYPDKYENIFLEICYKSGENGRDIINKYNRSNYGNRVVPNLAILTKNDFLETLKILILLYDSVSEINQEMVSFAIETALSEAIGDLDIRWKDGMFYPAGAKEFDSKLINDPLDWLKEFPDVRKTYLSSLSHFNISLTDSGARKDAITNAYSAIEGLSRKVLNNSKNFDKNSDELVGKLGLPNEYKNIIYYYKKIANGYSSRHAGLEFGHNETEAFVYFTGILIRLIVAKAK